jgi:hypothetical protein
MQIKTYFRWIAQLVFATTFLSVLLIQAGLASATQVPTISPSGGEYTSSETVTIGNIDSGDTAYYTTDGSNPETSSTTVTYSKSFTVSQSEIVRAAIKDSSGDWSSITTAVFIIDSSSSNSIDAPTISPSGGKYTSSETVTISNIDSGDTAYYTTDKSDPRTSSTATEYSGSFTVSQSEAVLAAVKDSSGDWSTVTGARFVIGNSSSNNDSYYNDNYSNTNSNNNGNNNWHGGSGNGNQGSGNNNWHGGSGNGNQGSGNNTNDGNINWENW